MSFGYAPKGWARCDGQLLPISQNQALFSLLGTTYGGDGRTNFALPDLQSKTALHRGAGYPLGQRGGEATHVLTTAEAPSHSHTATGSTAVGDSPIPVGNFLGGADNVYGALVNGASLDPSAITSAGGGQPHENMQPYLTLNFCIALQGVFPVQN